MVFDGLSLSPRHVYYPVERIMRLDEVAAARSAASTRISWTVVWMKAYAKVCADAAVAPVVCALAVAAYFGSRRGRIDDDRQSR
ncbi:MAG: hypothetical protein QM811_28870 [Pirellulales bacterium]